MLKKPGQIHILSTIKYEIPDAGFVTLKVYDVLGKKIWSENMGKRQAGLQRIFFSPHLIPGGISGGIYFYQLQSEDVILNNKMIYMP